MLTELLNQDDRQNECVLRSCRCYTLLMCRYESGKLTVTKDAAQSKFADNKGKP